MDGRPTPEEIKEAAGAIPVEWWARQRWFGGKGRDLRSTEVVDWGELPGAGRALLAVVATRFASGPEERYFVPLVAAAPDEAPDDAAAAAAPASTWPAGAAAPWRLYDALGFEGFRRRLLERLVEGGELPLRRGRLLFRPEERLRAAAGAAAASGGSRSLRAEQSNSAVVYGQSVFLKVFRRAVAGVNPDIEVSRFLTVEAGFPHSPAMLGSVAWRPEGRDGGGSGGGAGQEHALALAQAFVPSRGPAWEDAVGRLRDFLHRAREAGLPPSPASARRLAAAQLAGMRRLGALTARMHLALASSPDHPDFAPRPLAPADGVAWRDAARSRAAGAQRRLQERRRLGLPGGAAGLADAVLSAWPALEARLEGLAALGGAGVVATRIHGDYHLGQLLVCEGEGLQVLDFEGEPARPLEERRARLTPLKDVAGMLRSLAYAARTALRAGDGPAGAASPADATGAAGEWAGAWESCAREELLAGWRELAAGAPFVPADERVFAAALSALELEKALYELEYELDNRPDWLEIPLEGLRRALGA